MILRLAFDNGDCFGLSLEICQKLGSLLAALYDENKEFFGDEAMPWETLHLSGMGADGFRHLLRHCLYEYPLDPDNVYSLLEAAAYFGNMGVVRECFCYLWHHPEDADNTLFSLYWHDRAWIDVGYKIHFLCRLRQAYTVDEVFSFLVPGAIYLMKKMNLSPLEEHDYWNGLANTYLTQSALLSYQVYTPHRLLGLLLDTFFIVQEGEEEGHISWQYSDSPPDTLYRGPTVHGLDSWGFYNSQTGNSSGARLDDTLMILHLGGVTCELISFTFQNRRRGFATKTTLRLPALPSPRRRAVLLMSHYALYVCGGIDKSWGVSSDVQVWHRGSSTWVTESPLSTPRVGGRALVLGEGLYLYGEGGLEWRRKTGGPWSRLLDAEMVHDVRPFSDTELFVVTESPDKLVNDLLLDTTTKRSRLIRQRRLGTGIAGCILAL